LRYGIVKLRSQSAEELGNGARPQAAALEELVRASADAGVIFAAENLDPHLWAHQIVRSFGLPDTRPAMPAVTRRPLPPRWVR
jgi:hypothetical protein